MLELYASGHTRITIAAISIPKEAVDEENNTNYVGIHIFCNWETSCVNLSGIISVKVYGFIQSECSEKLGLMVCGRHLMRLIYTKIQHKKEEEAHGFLLRFGGSV